MASSSSSESSYSSASSSPPFFVLNSDHTNAAPFKVIPGDFSSTCNPGQSIVLVRDSSIELIISSAPISSLSHSNVFGSNIQRPSNAQPTYSRILDASSFRPFSDDKNTCDHLALLTANGHFSLIRWDDTLNRFVRYATISLDSITPFTNSSHMYANSNSGLWTPNEILQEMQYKLVIDPSHRVAACVSFRNFVTLIPLPRSWASSPSPSSIAQLHFPDEVIKRCETIDLRTNSVHSSHANSPLFIVGLDFISFPGILDHMVALAALTTNGLTSHSLRVLTYDCSLIQSQEEIEYEEQMEEPKRIEAWSNSRIDPSHFNPGMNKSYFTTWNPLQPLISASSDCILPPCSCLRSLSPLHPSHFLIASCDKNSSSISLILYDASLLSVPHQDLLLPIESSVATLAINDSISSWAFTSSSSSSSDDDDDSASTEVVLSTDHGSLLHVSFNLAVATAASEFSSPVSLNAVTKIASLSSPIRSLCFLSPSILFASCHLNTCYTLNFPALASSSLAAGTQNGQTISPVFQTISPVNDICLAPSSLPSSPSASSSSSSEEEEEDKMEKEQNYLIAGGKTLRVLRTGISLSVNSSSEEGSFSGVNGLWALKSELSSSVHSHLVMSLVSQESRVLALRASSSSSSAMKEEQEQDQEEAEAEMEDCSAEFGFDTSKSTVSAASLGHGFFFQCSNDGMLVVDSEGRRVLNWTLPHADGAVSASERISVCSILNLPESAASPISALCLLQLSPSNDLVCLRITASSITLIWKYSFAHTLSCIALSCMSSSSAQYGAILGTYEPSIQCITISEAGYKSIARLDISSISSSDSSIGVPESVVAIAEDDSHRTIQIVAGLRDGHVLCTSLIIHHQIEAKPLTASFSSSASRSGLHRLGNLPVRIVPLADSISSLVAISDRMWLGKRLASVSANSSLVWKFSPINFSAQDSKSDMSASGSGSGVGLMTHVSLASSLLFNDLENGIALITDSGSFVIAELDESHFWNITSIHMEMTVDKIIADQVSGHALALCSSPIPSPASVPSASASSSSSNGNGNGAAEAAQQKREYHLLAIDIHTGEIVARHIFDNSTIPMSLCLWNLDSSLSKRIRDSVLCIGTYLPNMELDHTKLRPGQVMIMKIIRDAVAAVPASSPSSPSSPSSIHGAPASTILGFEVISLSEHVPDGVRCISPLSSKHLLIAANEHLRVLTASKDEYARDGITLKSTSKHASRRRIMSLSVRGRILATDQYDGFLLFSFSEETGALSFVQGSSHMQRIPYGALLDDETAVSVNRSGCIHVARLNENAERTVLQNMIPVAQYQMGEACSNVFVRKITPLTSSSSVADAAASQSELHDIMSFETTGVIHRSTQIDFAVFMVLKSVELHLQAVLDRLTSGKLMDCPEAVLMEIRSMVPLASSKSFIEIRSPNQKLVAKGFVDGDLLYCFIGKLSKEAQAMILAQSLTIWAAALPDRIRKSADIQACLELDPLDRLASFEEKIAQVHRAVIEGIFAQNH